MSTDSMMTHSDGGRNTVYSIRVLYKRLLYPSISLCMLLAAVVMFRPVFNTNDNVSFIINGESGFISRYISVIFTWCIYSLSRVLPDPISGYGVMLYSVAFVGSLVWFNRISEIKNKLLLSSVVLFFSCYLFYFYVRIDYTSVAFIAVGAALLSFGNYIVNEPLRLAKPLALGLLLLAAWSVRIHALYGAIVFIIPALLLYLAFSRHDTQIALSRSKGRLLLVTVVFIAPLLVGMITDYTYRTFFVSETYRQYDEWNELRGEFHGYRVAGMNQRNRQAHEAAGWTASDYERLRHWLFFDERIYNSAAMRSFYANARQPSITDVSIAFAWRRIGPHLREYAAMWIVLIALSACALVFSRGAMYRAMLALGVFVLPATVITVMLLTARFPERVSTPSLFLALIACAVVLGKCVAPSEKSTRVEWLSFYTVCAIIVGAALYSIKDIYSGAERRGQIAERIFEKELAILNENYSSTSLLLQPGRSLWTQFQHPLIQPNIEFNPIFVGWSTFSPLFYRQISRLDIEHGYELLPAIVKRNDGLVVAREKWMDYVRDYLQDTGHTDVVARKQKCLGRGVCVYSLLDAENQNLSQD